MFRIGKNKIGDKCPAFIIAEAGVNHNGKLELALALVKSAKDAGASAIKFQLFKGRDVVTSESPKAHYQLSTTNPMESQLKMLEELELPLESYQLIVNECNKFDLPFICTCYSEAEVDFLESIGVAAYKLASCQIIEHDFLRYVAKKMKPIILSTGMSNFAEIDNAVRLIESVGTQRIAILQCTTNYPSPISDANLRVISTLKAIYPSYIVGYSDHTSDDIAAIVSVALGAKIIEKHFTLDKNFKGPDHSSSLSPQEFKLMSGGIRRAEEALGDSYKSPTSLEKKNMVGMRRAVVANKFIKKGATITREMLGIKRPAKGLHPSMLGFIVGSTASIDISEDTHIEFSMINWKHGIY